MPAKNTRVGVHSNRRRISWIKISICKDFFGEEEEEDDDDEEDKDDDEDDDEDSDTLSTSITLIKRLTIAINGSIAFKLILR